MKPHEFPILPTELNIFAPSNLRSTYNDAEFYNLCGYSFTAQQKNFFARQNDEEIAKGGVIDIRFGCSCRELEARYQLPHGTVGKWISNWKIGPYVNQDGLQGRRLSVDREGFLDFHKEIEHGKVNKKTGRKAKECRFSSLEETAMLNREIRRSKKRKGYNIDSDDETSIVSAKTMKKLKKIKISYDKDGKAMFKMQRGRGQEQTQARYEALSCTRMAVQQAVMIEGCMGHLPDSCKWNVDASTMIIEDCGKNGTMLRVVSCRKADEWEQDKLHKDPLSSIRFQTGLDVALKWMHLANGIGDFGSMVLIVSVPGMPDGRFHAVELQGLVFGPDNTSKGWIYFSASRCMKGLPHPQSPATTSSSSTSALQACFTEAEELAVSDDDEDQGEPLSNAWAHYFQGIFIESIKKFSNAYNMINPDTGERFEDVCTIDGENCVTRELLQDSVWTALSNANIRVIKNRPSGTAYDNANDAADNFRDKNAGLAFYAKNNINTTNKYLEANMDLAFTSLKTAFPMVTMTAKHWGKIKMGTSRFVYVCKSKYVTSSKAVIGFQRACQVRVADTELKRPILGREDSTVDAYRLLKRLCLTPIGIDDMNTIMEHFTEMLAEQKTAGRVDNRVMDRLAICCLPPGEFKNRDALCLAQQGPVELTHEETRRREAEYAVRKETAAKEKALNDATALIAAHLAKKNKLAADYLEKERVASLSKEEQATDPRCIEAQKKKDNAKATKLAAEHARNAKLLAAKVLVNAVC